MPLVIVADGRLKDIPLTTRELEVMNFWAEGRSQREIAYHLHLSVETVKKHLKNAYRKLDAHSRLEALRNGGYL